MQDSDASLALQTTVKLMEFDPQYVDPPLACLLPAVPAVAEPQGQEALRALRRPAGGPVARDSAAGRPWICHPQQGVHESALLTARFPLSLSLSLSFSFSLFSSPSLTCSTCRLFFVLHLTPWQISAAAQSAAKFYRFVSVGAPQRVFILTSFFCCGFYVLGTIASLKRYAVLLKQVANFYNTIHEQVIDSQFAMLEAQARSFEAVIKHPRGKGSKDGVLLTGLCFLFHACSVP